MQNDLLERQEIKIDSLTERVVELTQERDRLIQVSKDLVAKNSRSVTPTPVVAEETIEVRSDFSESQRK